MAGAEHPESLPGAPQRSLGTPKVGLGIEQFFATGDALLLEPLLAIEVFLGDFEQRLGFEFITPHLPNLGTLEDGQDRSRRDLVADIGA